MEGSMNKRIKKLWINALRSGKFIQGRRKLRSGRKPNNRHCCLGVLEELAVQAGVIKSFRSTDAVLCDKVMKWAGLSKNNPKLGRKEWAIGLNDSGKSFNFIATRIEKWL